MDAVTFITVIGTGIGVVAILGGWTAWFVRNQIGSLRTEMGRRLDTLERTSRILLVQSEAQTKALADLIALLHSVSGMTEEQRRTLVRMQGTYLVDLSRSVMTEELRHPNPLTREQVLRMQGYLDRIEKGDLFTPEEVEDYQEVAAIVRRERDPYDERVAALVILGIFLAALFILGKKQP